MTEVLWHSEPNQLTEGVTAPRPNTGTPDVRASDNA